MLSTINGFDLLLILIIIALGYRAYSLNRECESYVQQILRQTWDHQEELLKASWKTNDIKFRLQELEDKLYPTYDDEPWCTEPATEPASWDWFPENRTPF